MSDRAKLLLFAEYYAISVMEPGAIETTREIYKLLGLQEFHRLTRICNDYAGPWDSCSNTEWANLILLVREVIK